MKNLAILLAISALLLAAMAGTAGADIGKLGAIRGCLTDFESGTPITGAWVAIQENNIGTRTDSAGCFRIENVVPGQYHLILTHAEYGTVSGFADLIVSVKPGQTVEISVKLRGIARQAEQKKDYYRGGRPSKSLLGEVVGLVGGEDETSVSQSAELPALVYKPHVPAPVIPSGLPIDGRTGSHSQQKLKQRRYVGRLPADDDYSYPPRDMFFRDYGTSGFTSVRRDRFSTFAIDVDDASFNLVRQYLMDGNNVPVDAVRVEEFINHFDYGYNVPGGDIFRVFSEVSNSPFDRDRQIMKIAVKGREISRRERTPLNITLVVDVSGSMGNGNRFALVRQSVKALVGQLNRQDRIGIVAYGSNAYVALEPVAGRRQQQILKAFDRLHPGGSTYAEAGIKLGYQMADRQFVEGHNNLLFLFSDGVANVGRTSPEAIMREIERHTTRGISLNSYGFGMGNYNDLLLEQLAQTGNGRYAYINNRNEVRVAFVDDFVSSTQMLARDVKIQVEFNPKLVQSYRLLGYENRDVPDHRFRDDRQDGGEIGAGTEVTALYELVMSNRRGNGKLATITVRWKNAAETNVSELVREVKWNRHLTSFGQARPEMRLAIVAGRLAEKLKGTQYAVSTSYEDLYRLASRLRQDIPGEQTDELFDMIRRAGNLTRWHANDDDDDEVYGNYKR